MIVTTSRPHPSRQLNSRRKTDQPEARPSASGHLPIGRSRNGVTLRLTATLDPESRLTGAGKISAMDSRVCTRRSRMNHLRVRPHLLGLLDLAGLAPVHHREHLVLTRDPQSKSHHISLTQTLALIQGYRGPSLIS